jgi:hypothetical protein
VALVVCVLVTNSIVHATLSVHVTLSPADDRVLLTVRDYGDGHPTARSAEPPDHLLGGRGLPVAEESTLGWGVLAATPSGQDRVDGVRRNWRSGPSRSPRSGFDRGHWPDIGDPPRVVMEIAGHSVIETTMNVYGHLAWSPRVSRGAPGRIRTCDPRIRRRFRMVAGSLT